MRQGKINVLGVVKNSKVRDQLLNILNEIQQCVSKVVIGEIDSLNQELGEYKEYNVVLIQVENKDSKVIESLKDCQSIVGKTSQPFIIISDSIGHTDMIKLVRMGISDFLSLPLDETETKESVVRVAEKNRDNSSPINSQIITFAHASGGMGATTLAVNAATIINDAVGKESASCLLDLDLQFGGASIHLDLPGYSPVMDLLDKPDRLDREMLEGMMMRHTSGLRVLTTPETPLPVEAINGEIIERFLKLAENRYRYIVVDMPQTMTLWTDTVFKKSKIIYVVTQLNVPSIRQLKRWFSVLDQEGIGNLPIKVVVNRHSSLGRIKHDNITLAQASEALGRKIDYAIPNDYEIISESLDQGMPASSIYPKSKFIRQLKTMLHQVVDEVEVPKTSFFNR